MRLFKNSSLSRFLAPRKCHVSEWKCARERAPRIRVTFRVRLSRNFLWLPQMDKKARNLICVAMIVDNLQSAELIRGTQRLFSKKYLFGEAKIA